MACSKIHRPSSCPEALPIDGPQRADFLAKSAPLLASLNPPPGPTLVSADQCLLQSPPPFVYGYNVDVPDLKAPSCYINRELSFLEFNHRVLALAFDDTLPLLERLKFLCISSGQPR